MKLINYLKNYFQNYFQKGSTNPTSTIKPNSIENWITKVETNPKNKNSALVHVRTLDGKIVVYSIPKHTISEGIIREREAYYV